MEGKYKAGTIYDPTPYGAGTVDRYTVEDKLAELFTEEVFDFDDFYRECMKREPVDSMTSAEAAAAADPSLWNYSTPDGGTGFSYANDFDYFLMRWFAVVDACGIGTYGSEGFELCGSKLERDSHKAVVEWLTGDRRAFTDAVSNIEIAADWSNGNVAMSGTSYGGTIPFEVAVTGVKGLKTIIPVAGIASWYDYTNSQGIPIRNTVNYVDYLAGNNAGGTFLDGDWDQPNPLYGSWLWTIAKEQEDTNGDYAPVWEAMDYTTDEENHIECSALVVSGLNDYNVTTRHAAMMVEAFQKAGKTVKLVLHQGGHINLGGVSINGTVWDEILNAWLSHYLFGVENDVESLPAVMAQNNITGTFDAFDAWPGEKTITLKTDADEDKTILTSEGIGPYSMEYQENHQNNLTYEDQEDFYLTLPKEYAASYRFDPPAGTTIQGTPAVHVLLDSDRQDLDGLMITAVLIDVSDHGEFLAYLPKTELEGDVEEQELELTYSFEPGDEEWPMRA
ncbi:MAG: prolyl oligopeptidase family serine peptidase, partial [Clostridia bacterium]|nr:prolyl oligopeptidase family serine peptidase [Clostridia bacterium]